MGRREAFDPLRSYVVSREFRWSGKLFKPGEAFNDRGDMRRFRQLYDGRYLRMSEVDTGAPAFTLLTDNQLREWLTQRGMASIAHPRSTRQRLIERCQRAWLAEQQGASDGVTARHDDPQSGGSGVQGPPAERSDLETSVRRRERLR